MSYRYGFDPDLEYYDGFQRHLHGRGYPRRTYPTTEMDVNGNTEVPEPIQLRIWDEEERQEAARLREVARLEERQEARRQQIIRDADFKRKWDAITRRIELETKRRWEEITRQLPTGMYSWRSVLILIKFMRNLHKTEWQFSLTNYPLQICIKH